MSWEIQGHVNLDNAADDLAALPITEEPNDNEHGQVDAIRAALASLLATSSIGGPAVFVRAGGTGNPNHEPGDGLPHEFLTLTIEYAPDAPAEPEVPETVEEPVQAPVPPPDPNALGEPAPVVAPAVPPEPAEAG